MIDSRAYPGLANLEMDWKPCRDRTFATAERMESRHSQICSIGMWGRGGPSSILIETKPVLAASAALRPVTISSGQLFKACAAVLVHGSRIRQSHRGLFLTTLLSWGNAGRHRTGPNQNGRPGRSGVKL